MNKTLMARASISIHAPASRVWEALMDPQLIEKYLFGAHVLTDWSEGSPIVYKGVYEGRDYEDKGRVLRVEPEKALLITHWSPLSGSADSPENYHTVRYDLAPEADGTLLTITQDNNPNEAEQEQNSKFWQMILDGIKKLLEN